MQSAPNTQKILNLLRSKGHQFSSQRNVLQACKDGKFLLNLLKDLTQNFQMSFMRRFTATESNSFSSDHQRLRFSYPQICNYLIICELVQLFGGKLSLSMLSKNSKEGGQQIWQLLGKLTSFNETKQKILQKSEQYRMQFQLIKSTFRKANQVVLQAEKRKKQLIALKQTEKASFDLKTKILQQYQKNTQQKNKMFADISSENNSIKDSIVSGQIYQTQLKRNIEQQSIKIAQIKRQLSRIAPDILKRREHIQLRLQDNSNRRNFKLNQGRELQEACDICLRQAKGNYNYINDRANQLVQQLNSVADQQKITRQLQIEINTLEPEIISYESEQKNENQRIQQLQSQQKQLDDFISAIQRQLKQQQEQIQKEKVQEDQFNKILQEFHLCRRQFQEQRRKIELQALAFYEEQHEAQKNAQKILEEWEANFIKSLTQFSKPFDSIDNQ